MGRARDNCLQSSAAPEVVNFSTLAVCAIPCERIVGNFPWNQVVAVGRRDAHRLTDQIYLLQKAKSDFFAPVQISFARHQGFAVKSVTFRASR
jgi:hypothetical protein